MLQRCLPHALGLTTFTKRLGKTAFGQIVRRWDGVVGVLSCRLSRLIDSLGSGSGSSLCGEVAVCAFKYSARQMPLPLLLV
jgi:hypothetical protein